MSECKGKNLKQGDVVMVRPTWDGKCTLCGFEDNDGPGWERRAAYAGHKTDGKTRDVFILEQPVFCLQCGGEQAYITIECTEGGAWDVADSVQQALIRSKE